MGRLHRLEIENFKSYSGKHIIGPFSDFTAIIGPNGSGKSNMMDAISFVLGIQSKHLRSTQLKELIFRRDSNAVPSRKASVTLVYEPSEGEIEGAENRREIHFTRSVLPSGVASYRIDGREVTFEAYETVLRSIGVLVKARNFLVFQGDVESVASKSPQELTKLLSQISHADQYEEEYEELLRKKVDAEETTMFSLQKKKMYATQRKEIKEQKDEAEMYMQKQTELEELKTEQTLWQIYRIKSGMSERRLGSESLYAELDESKSAEAAAEEDLQESKKALAKSTRLLQNAEKDLSTKEKQMTKLYPKLTTAQEKSKQTRKRITDLEAGEKRLGKDITAQEEYVAGLRADMAALEDAERSLKAELARIASRTGGAGSSLQLNADMMMEYTRIRGEVAARTSKEKTEETNLEREAVSRQNRIEDLRAQEAAVRKEIEGIKALIAEYQERAKRIGLLMDENRNEIKQTDAQQQSMANEAAAAQESIANLTTSIESLSERLKEAGEDRVRGKREQTMTDAVESMMRIFTGVHGRLVDLCKPIQKKYSTAIATASGKHMEAIVVDTKQAAAECIRYLKDQRVGTCMFLPLDNIATKPIPDRLRGLGQKYKLAVDLVECEDLFKPAVSYALGATVVCDTLEEAQHLRFQTGEHVKVVTLNGHVITKAGTMTGGSTGREGRDRWEDREVDELKKQKAAAEDALVQLKRNIPSRQTIVDLEIKLKSLQTRIQFNEADMTVCTEKLAHFQQQRDLKTASLDQIASEIATNEAAVAKIQRTLSQLKATIGAVETEEFREFSARLGIDNICEYEQNVLKAHQAVLAKSGAIAEQKAALSAQLEYELKRDFKTARDKQLAQIAAAKRELEATETELKALSKEEDEIRATIRACSEAITKLKASKNADYERSKELQKLRSDAAAARDAIGRKISAEEIEVERMRSQLHEMLQKAMVDEIALPTVNVDRRASTGTARGRMSRGQSIASSGDVEVDLDLEWAGTNTQRRSSGRFGRSEEPSASDTSESAHFSQSDNPVVVRDSNAVSLVDLSSLSSGPHKSALNNKQQQADLIASLGKKIANIAAELRTMQPNMHAAERFEGINDKLKECNENLDQVRDSSKQVAERFEEVKALRHKLFMECFEHVSEALTIIYKDLTKSSKHPLGGNAYLTLDNNEEPYLGGIRYTAMPPMKRYRDMDQLSGGEKTVAALALLFSIHSYRQAPFFVLDEVDAALDNVNVQKVCHYIRQRSKNFQCIVISLKDMFFEHADVLFGVCKDVNSLSSRVLSLNLRDYPVQVPPNAVVSDSVRELEKAMSKVMAAAAPGGGASKTAAVPPSASTTASGISTTTGAAAASSPIRKARLMDDEEDGEEEVAAAKGRPKFKKAAGGAKK